MLTEEEKQRLKHLNYSNAVFKRRSEETQLKNKQLSMENRYLKRQIEMLRKKLENISVAIEKGRVWW